MFIIVHECMCKVCRHLCFPQQYVYTCMSIKFWECMVQWLWPSTSLTAHIILCMLVWALTCTIKFMYKWMNISVCNLLLVRGFYKVTPWCSPGLHAEWLSVEAVVLPSGTNWRQRTAIECITSHSYTPTKGASVVLANRAHQIMWSGVYDVLCCNWLLVPSSAMIMIWRLL